jgi:Fe-S oxidoreductase
MKRHDSTRPEQTGAAVEVGPALRKRLQTISLICTNCDLCKKECAFLRERGTPKEIADTYDPSASDQQAMPFECGLCGLCTAVCPVGADPCELFLEMRKEAVRRGGGNYPGHAILSRYEKRGTSRTLSYYGLPEGCENVFFPGCALSGTRSERVIQVYQRLKAGISSLGIVLDCCTKPSHDLGKEDYFTAMFGEMKDYLVARGVRSVLVACPSCYKVFAQYGNGLTVRSIYEVLADDERAGRRELAATVTVHDPCAVRSAEPVLSAVRKLIARQGLTVEEMPHSMRTTLCCGEVSAAGSLSRGLAESWGRLRREEAAGRSMVTYCAGCANALSRLAPTTHLLDMLFEPEPGLLGRVKVTKPPFTYWKRLRLKKWFKKHVPAAVSRERTFIAGMARVTR